MTHEVILRRKAEDDIRTVLRWYETQDPTLGDQFLIELRRTLEQIGQFPESSPAMRKNVRRALVQRFPYGFRRRRSHPGRHSRSPAHFTRSVCLAQEVVSEA